MGKKNKKPKEPQERVITGSGADVSSHEDEQGKVKCKCIIPCVWRGYRDEGDTVWIEKELIEKDAFIKAHFKVVDGDELFKNSVKGPQGDPKGAPGSDNADGGEDAASTEEGKGEDECKGEGQGEGEGEDQGEGADGNGQGELELK